MMSALPVELVIDIQEDQMTFFENEKEKDSEKEGKEKKNEKEKRKKTEQKDKLSKKFLSSTRLVEVVTIEKNNRIAWLHSAWDSLYMEVLSPPPELMLG